jgi:hypothetical protein
VLAAGIGAALAVAPPSPPGGASLAPWDGRAEARWDGDGWVAAPAPSFSVAASRLPLDALLARAATRPAPGLRAGVDCAELLRRCLLAVGISALTASGLAIGRARGVREGGDIVLRAALRAGAAGAAWCCASAVAVASVAL